MEVRRLYVYRPAGWTFAGFGEAVAFPEDETTGFAGGGDNFEMFIGFA